MDTPINNKPGMSSQVVYKITVRGKLPENWADWFNGTIVSTHIQSERASKTIITCQVKDQAELMGILNTLNSLNLPLLTVSINYIDEGENHE